MSQGVEHQSLGLCHFLEAGSAWMIVRLIIVVGMEHESV